MAHNAWHGAAIVLGGITYSGKTMNIVESCPEIDVTSTTSGGTAEFISDVTRMDVSGTIVWDDTKDPWGNSLKAGQDVSCTATLKSGTSFSGTLKITQIDHGVPENGGIAFNFQGVMNGSFSYPS